MTPSTNASSEGKGGKGIGIVLALIVFVVLLFVVIGKSDGKTKVGVKELKIEKVDKESVDKIEVTLAPKKAAPDAGPVEGGSKRIVLEKSAGTWQVFDPTAATQKHAVDEGQLKGALDAIGEFSTGDLIANKKAKHAELEIDDEQGQTVTVSAKGKPVLSLVFGRPAKGGGSTVRRADSEDVFVAKGRLGAVLKKDLGAWRKKALFDLKADDIARLSITTGVGTYTPGTLVLESTAAAPAAAPDAGPATAAKAEWSLREPAELPPGFRLDKAQLSRPAAAFVALRAQDFADGTSDADAGLTQPHTVVEATARDGKKVVLLLGREDDKKRVYAKVDGDPQTYLLASFGAKQLQKTLDDLHELTLLNATIDDVEKVTFKGSKGTVVVAKDGADWKLVEPKTPPADFEVSQIAGQVAGLLRTRATRVQRYALENAEGNGPVVEVQLAGGKKQVLRFGSALPLEDKAPDAGPAGKASEPREYFVKGGTDDLTYVIAAFTRNRYDKPSELFKKPPAPPPGMGGQGGIPGMESLPPDIRKKLEESMKKGDMPSGHP